jgi:hypothetical protein
MQDACAGARSSQAQGADGRATQAAKKLSIEYVMMCSRASLRCWITLALVGSTAPASPLERARAADPATVLIELFTSEGCSSCPPADTLLQRFVDASPVAGVQIIALGEHVDYWDQQGWTDRFSSAALTNRQRIYSQAFNLDSVYTPQLVVDGRTECVGSDAAAARRAIGQALSAPHGAVRLAIEPAHGDTIAVSVQVTDLPKPGRGDRDEVVLAVTEDRLKSDVRRGENRGRVLVHAAVVRRLAAIGDAMPEQPARTQITIDPAWQRDNVKIVAFVQESRSRRIVAAAAVPLQSAPR